MKKKVLGFLICMLVLTTLVQSITIRAITSPTEKSTQIASNGDDWPMFHHDPQHTGFSTSLAPNTADLLWVTDLEVNKIEGSPTVVGDVLYLGGTIEGCPQTGKICLINATDGSIRKTIWTDGGVSSSPAIYDFDNDPFMRHMYIGLEESGEDSYQMCCYWVGIPEQAFWVWGHPSGSHWPVTHSPTVIDDKAYFSESQNAWRFEARGGEIEWRNRGMSGPLSSPAIVNDKFYVGTHMGAGGGIVWCFNLSDDDENGVYWFDRQHDGVVSSPAIIDDRLYIGCKDGDILCYDADPDDNGDGVIDENDNDEGEQDGPMYGSDRIWTYHTPGSVGSSPAIAYGNIYIGSNDGFVYCLDAEGNGDGTTALIWKYETGDYVWSSPAVADGKIYVGSYDNNIYCLNAMNGKPIWTYISGDFIRGSPAIDAEGRLYIGSMDGCVYAFDYLPNNPPNLPNNPEPTNGETNVDIDTILSWSGGDPDTGQITTYDIYFGTTSPPPKVASNQSLTIYDPGILEYETTYYWKIVAWDGLGENSESQEWSFTTGGPQPEFEIGEITGENIGVETVIRNIGEGDAIDGEWSITFDGGIILLPLGRVKTGLFDTLAAGDELPIGAVPLGIGGFQRPLEITVAVDATNADPVNVTVQAMVFLISVIILD